MRLKLYLWISVFLLMIQSGCTVPKSLVFNDKSCTAPCWRNIMPGVTTENELLTNLHKMPDIKTGSIHNNGRPSDVFDDIVFFELNSKETAKAYILNNKVMQLEFDDIVNVKFQDSIQNYGNPRYIQTIHTQGIDLFDTSHTEVASISPEKGIAYGFDAEENNVGAPEAIKPDSGISWIDYFDSSSYQKLLENGLFSPIYSHPWQGYGIIATKYPYP